ncbi:MAG: hypothetical protein HY735_33690 [Verrucomicrobia bacterium]|nr:hypothetical protein [Verrucomicrobiota bacterium]
MKTLVSPFVCSLAFTIVAILSASAHSAIEPAPRNEPGWQNRQKLLNQRAIEAGEKAQVIFIGDSITQGWEGEGKEVWAQYYAHRSAVNLGIGGDRTQHVLWRLENGNLNGLKPKAAVVMIGTNNSNGEDNTPGQIAEGVTAIVRKLREKLPETRILLLAIFPRSENFSAQRGKILQVNQVLHKLADGKSIFWLDFGHRFLNDDGTIPRDLMPDYLHLSRKGYEIWAEAIEQRLSQVIGDQRVKSAGASNVDLTGEWVWSMPRPDAEPVQAPLILKSQGDKVAGRFARDETRWLEIQEGRMTGNEFSWTVKRDRADGSMVTYRMSGKLADGKIVGVAKATIEGQEITSEWSARRK